jgi:hypothetical protein
MRLPVLLFLAVSVANAADTPPIARGVTGMTPSMLAPGFISTMDDDSHPTLSADGRTLYFLKNTPSFDFYTIVESSWRGDGWGPIRTVSFSGQYPDGDLVFVDESHAFFVSARPVDGKPRTDTEIWSVERTASGWSEPKHVRELSSPGDEWFPTLTREGTVYFGSTREGGHGGCDLWRAKLVDGRFQPPENLGAPLNSAAEEIEAYIAPDESYIVFAAKGRPKSLGQYDLYVSERQGGTWLAPRNAGAPINSSGWDFSPRMTPDGRYFTFTSSRGFGSQPLERRLEFEELQKRIRAPGNGLRDIYVVDKRALGLK